MVFSIVFNLGPVDVSTKNIVLVGYSWHWSWGVEEKTISSIIPDVGRSYVKEGNCIFNIFYSSYKIPFGRIQPNRTPGKLNTATSFSTSILCTRCGPDMGPSINKQTLWRCTVKGELIFLQEDYNSSILCLPGREQTWERPTENVQLMPLGSWGAFKAF